MNQKDSKLQDARAAIAAKRKEMEDFEKSPEALTLDGQTIRMMLRNQMGALKEQYQARVQEITGKGGLAEQKAGAILGGAAPGQDVAAHVEEQAAWMDRIGRGGLAAEIHKQSPKEAAKRKVEQEMRDSMAQIQADREKESDELANQFKAVVVKASVEGKDPAAAMAEAMRKAFPGVGFDEGQAGRAAQKAERAFQAEIDAMIAGQPGLSRAEAAQRVKMKYLNQANAVANENKARTAASNAEANAGRQAEAEAKAKQQEAMLGGAEFEANAEALFTQAARVNPVRGQSRRQAQAIAQAQVDEHIRRFTFQRLLGMGTEAGLAETMANDAPAWYRERAAINRTNRAAQQGGVQGPWGGAGANNFDPNAQRQAQWDNQVGAARGMRSVGAAPPGAAQQNRALDLTAKAVGLAEGNLQISDQQNARLASLEQFVNRTTQHMRQTGQSAQRRGR